MRVEDVPAEDVEAAIAFVKASVAAGTWREEYRTVLMRRVTGARRDVLAAALGGIPFPKATARFVLP